MGTRTIYIAIEAGGGCVAVAYSYTAAVLAAFEAGAWDIHIEVV